MQIDVPPKINIPIIREYKQNPLDASKFPKKIDCEEIGRSKDPKLINLVDCAKDFVSEHQDNKRNFGTASAYNETAHTSLNGPVLSGTASVSPSASLSFSESPSPSAEPEV